MRSASDTSSGQGPYPHLLHDHVTMGLDRALGTTYAFGSLLVAISAKDKIEDFSREVLTLRCESDNVQRGLCDTSNWTRDRPFVCWK